MEQEIKLFIDLVYKHHNLFDSSYMHNQLKKHVKLLVNSPLESSVTNYIVKHIKMNKPLSVIRLGDGEMNLLTFSQYSEFPKISYHTANESIQGQKHSFVSNKNWMFLFEQMMITAINEADIVGVLGLWRAKEKKTVNFVSNIPNNLRGTWGQWTGLDHILTLSHQGCLKDKFVTSAHLYFGILKHLHLIFNEVQNIYLITDQFESQKILSAKYPNNFFHLINTPVPNDHSLNFEPTYLYDTMNQLPNEMRDSVTLVGAGIWSEFYCTWIKRRGGIAIDIGSGFDLILNRKVRPIHHSFDLENYLIS